MGQVCAKHQEFYETDCRYCPKRFEGYDTLLVSAQVPVFKKVRDPFFEEYLGAEKIGPRESKFWMDFISQDFCKDEDPNDGHGALE